MNSTVHAQLDEADYVAAQRLCRRRTAWWPIAGLLVTIALAWVAFRAYRSHNTFAVYLSLGALIGGLVGGLGTRYILGPWQARRIFRQQKAMHRAFELSWDSDGIHLKDGNGEYRHSWRDFMRWREDERLFVLNLSDVMFLMVPKRAFPEEQSLHVFRDALKSHVAS